MTPALGIIAILVAVISVRAALATIRADDRRRRMFARLNSFRVPVGDDPMQDAFGEICAPPNADRQTRSGPDAGFNIGARAGTSHHQAIHPVGSPTSVSGRKHP